MTFAQERVPLTFWCADAAFQDSKALGPPKTSEGHVGVFFGLALLGVGSKGDQKGNPTFCGDALF